jgi:hypothetical protein
MRERRRVVLVVLFGGGTRPMPACGGISSIAPA